MNYLVFSQSVDFFYEQLNKLGWGIGQRFINSATYSKLIIVCKKHKHHIYSSNSIKVKNSLLEPFP